MGLLSCGPRSGQIWSKCVFFVDFLLLWSQKSEKSDFLLSLLSYGASFWFFSTFWSISRGYPQETGILVGFPNTKSSLSDRKRGCTSGLGSLGGLQRVLGGRSGAKVL